MFRFTHIDLLGNKRSFEAHSELGAEQQLRFELVKMDRIEFNRALRIIHSGDWVSESIHKASRS